MSQLTINIGSAPNDTTGDPLRTAFTKVNANFTELYSRADVDNYVSLSTTGQQITDTSGTTNYTLKIASGTTGSVFGIRTGTESFGIANDSLDHTGTSYVPYNITAAIISLNVPGHAASLSVEANGLVSVNNGIITNKLTFPNNLGAPNINGTTDAIRLYDFGNEGTQYNYAIGAEGSHIWFGVDVPNSDNLGFKFYGGGTLAAKITTAGNLYISGIKFPDSSTQTTAWTGILPSPTYSGSSSIGNVTPAPLNLNNTGSAGQVKTQLTLINTAGNGNTGSAIDFYTYTDQGNGVPGTRLQSIDNNNYSANFSIALKGVGNAGNNTLTTKWTFGADASLTFPDTSVQTTAYLGTATTSQIGGVQPDGTSITISNGVISSASSFQPNGVFNIVTANTTTVLTSATAQNLTLTGSNTQTIQLPDATTLKAGWIFRINNNSSSASNITVNNAGGSQVGLVPQGGDTQVILLDNSTANGSWDYHGWIPSNLLMGSSIFQLGSSAYTIAPYNSSLTIGTSTGGTTYNFGTGSTLSGNTKTINIGTGGVSGSTTTITVGSASGTSTTAFNGTTTFNAAVKLNGLTTMGIVATAQTAGTVASAATIAPTNPITFISGNTQITTITPPSGIATYGGQITLIPIGTWTTATGGNIALATTTVTNKALIMTYDAGTSKWYPSY